MSILVIFYLLFAAHFRCTLFKEVATANWLTGKSSCCNACISAIKSLKPSKSKLSRKKNAWACKWTARAALDRSLKKVEILEDINSDWLSKTTCAKCGFTVNRVIFSRSLVPSGERNPFDNSNDNSSLCAAIFNPFPLLILIFKLVCCLVVARRTIEEESTV